MAHSVRSFFSASHPRICLGTFSTVSPVIEFQSVHFQIQYFTSKSTKSLREFFSFHESNSEKKSKLFPFLNRVRVHKLIHKNRNLLIRQWCLSIILNSMKMALEMLQINYE